MTRELAAKFYTLEQSRVIRTTSRQKCFHQLVRAIAKGIVAGAIVAAAQPTAHAQAPVIRDGRDGRPVMHMTAPQEVNQSPQGSRFPLLQPTPETPELQQIYRPQTNYPQFQVPSTQSTQPAFNIAPTQQSQNVQLVAERRSFLDVLMPWRRRNTVPNNYEQPIEPPNQYQSNPLPANAATEFGPAMSGFQQQYTRPPQQTPTTPPRTAQGAPSAITPPIVRRPPATPPQATGTATTNDGRELPVFQFGTGSSSANTPLTPPPAPRVDPNASPMISPSTTNERPQVTPATPAPPIMPLRSPSSSSPPVSESASSQQIDPPAFEDPVILEDSASASPFPAPPSTSSLNQESSATAFPPPPSGTPSAPALTAPTTQPNAPPAFAPPGAPTVELNAEPPRFNPAPGPQLSATPPALTPPTAAVQAPLAFADDQQAEESSEDKLARIHERRNQTGLKGFCPVMLRDHRELVDAQPEFAVEFNGETYYVSSAEAQATFSADPVKYAPAAGGSDVIHRDLTGEDLPGSLDYAVWYRGRLYMFATAETLETFVAAPAAHRTDL